MNIGLCSKRHVVRTNDGEEMDYFLFSAPVEHPTHIEIIEKVCRDFITTYLIGASGGDSHYEDCNLYVTGLTPLLTSFLKCWLEKQERLEMTVGDLVLWHWDTETEQYIPQKWAVIT